MKSRMLLSTVLIAPLLALTPAAPAMSVEDRQSYCQMLLLNLPPSPPFDQWILRTKELPPDFDALPRHAGLPDPLSFLNGKPVQSPADWNNRRAEILDLYQQYIWGKLPPRPNFDHAAMNDGIATGYRTRTGTLFAGPDAQGALRLTLQIPEGPGPFPVVLGPNLISGPANPAPDIIRARGYIVASYAAADGNDDTPDLAALYPQADPGALPRRAWAASLVLDYLQRQPEVEPQHIAIGGYGRDAKTAIIAAALDTRIAAVIAGSPGIGGITPFRLAGEINQSESIQTATLTAPNDFHLRFRYFVGREDRLPVDGNLLLATLAPRPFFLLAGQTDETSNPFADEQSFHSAQKVYDLLDAKNALGTLRLPGAHGVNDWNQSMAWLDIQFARSQKTWTNQWIFPWDFTQWQKSTGETVDLAKFPPHKPGDLLTTPTGLITTTAAWEAKAADVRKNITWMLGDPTPAANPKLTPTPLPADPPNITNWVLQRSIAGDRDFGWYAEDNIIAASRPVTFNGIKATLYYPRSAPPGAKLPTVIWLHSYSYPMGTMWPHRPEAIHPVLGLVDNGYAVLAYDQSGMGTRMNQAAAFYDRTPHWSHMGQMVADARAAVDTLAKDPALDAQHIYLFGFGLGGNVALHTAALEPKVAGVVAVAAFTPLRTDTADKGAGGIARYSLDHSLLPRLGFFVGNESQIPYDYDEILAAIAPRPVYIANPLFDRNANFTDIHAAATAAKKVYSLYKADPNLRLDEPYDYNRLSPFLQDRILMWMGSHMK